MSAEHSEYQCNECGRIYSRLFNLRRHEREHFKSPIIYHICAVCKLQFSTKLQYDQHMIDKHVNESDFIVRNSSFQGHCVNYRKTLRTDFGIEILLTEKYFNEIVNFLKNQLLKHTYFKFNLTLICAYQAAIVDDTTVTKQVPFRTNAQKVTNGTHIPELVDDTIQELIETGTACKACFKYNLRKQAK